MSACRVIEARRCFGGVQGVYEHDSDSTACAMRFSVFVPPTAAGGPLPVLYFLSGLTCTWENFTAKAGAQRLAAEKGLVLVVCDTSPRGVGLPGEDDASDFGTGAGFYVDATEAPWSKHYRMYSYVTEELPRLIREHFPTDGSRQGIFGHSMGGHGALTLALRNPGMYRSVSAFSPIVAPSQVPWGQKAFLGYLGQDRDRFSDYDATELCRSTTWRSPILIDQGMSDPFLAEQLRPELFEAAASAAGIPVTVRRHEGYDHSYYFIATFVADHIEHHARALA